MRHAFAPRPKSLGSLGVRQAPSAAALVVPTGLAQRSPPSERSAAVGAVDLAAVAARADIHLLVATCAEKEASCIVHRRSAIGRRAIDRRAGGVLYCAYTCACHGGGTTFGYDLQVYPVSCPVSPRRNRLPLRRHKRETLAGTFVAPRGRVHGRRDRAIIKTKRTAVESVDELHERNLR